MDEAAGQLHPMTKDLTSGVVRPGGEALSKNAVPVTKDIAENRVQPAVDQVIPFCCILEVPIGDPSISQHKRSLHRNECNFWIPQRMHHTVLSTYTH